MTLFTTSLLVRISHPLGSTVDDGTLNAYIAEDDSQPAGRWTRTSLSLPDWEISGSDLVGNRSRSITIQGLQQGERAVAEQWVRPPSWHDLPSPWAGSIHLNTIQTIPLVALVFLLLNPLSCAYMDYFKFPSRKVRDFCTTIYILSFNCRTVFQRQSRLHRVRRICSWVLFCNKRKTTKNRFCRVMGPTGAGKSSVCASPWFFIDVVQSRMNSS